jgi:hypothetical protein
MTRCDTFLTHVTLKVLGSALAVVAALLDAAERCLGNRGHEGVDGEKLDLCCGGLAMV